MKIKKIYILILTVFLIGIQNGFAFPKWKWFEKKNEDNILVGNTINEKLKNLSEVCNKIYSSYKCAQKLENQEIEKYSNIVKRNQDKLIINLNKDKKIYTDKKHLHYSFQTFLPEKNIVIIHVQGYESEGLHLINIKTGDLIKTSTSCFFNKDQCVFSSKGNKLILAGYNEMNSDLSGLEIWQIKDNKFIKEYEDKTFRYYSSIDWVNDNKINVYFNYINKKEEKWEKRKLILNFINNKWIITDNKKL